jgi:hypothetical protein
MAGEMQGLDKQEVKLLAIGDNWKYIDADKATVLLKPAVAITRPKAFELTLTCPCPHDEAPWKALPCQTQRVECSDYFERRACLEVVVDTQSVLL